MFFCENPHMLSKQRRIMKIVDFIATRMMNSNGSVDFFVITDFGEK
jgi:hypothetical protein